MDEWIFVGEFASKVVEYIRLEWEVELSQFQPEIQDRAFQVIGGLKGRHNVPNIAAKIAMEVIPI